jgi:hypothetical protein
MAFHGRAIDSEFPQPLLAGWVKLVAPEQVFLLSEQTRKIKVLDVDLITAGFVIDLIQSNVFGTSLNVVTFSLDGCGFVDDAFQQFQLVITRSGSTNTVGEIEL